MRLNTKVTFAMRDLDRLKCIQAVVDGDLKPIRAADRLGLTTRQVRRLARRYAAAGPVGLISKRFNRPSNNRLDDALADRPLALTLLPLTTESAVCSGTLGARRHRRPTSRRCRWTNTATCCSLRRIPFR